MPDPLQLDARHTALVLIDLQRAILQRPVAPHTAQDVLARAARLAAGFRAKAASVALVRVSYSSAGAELLNQRRDAPAPALARERGWDELAPELGRDERDILITKHQWGAFYGTGLDLHLRRRGIRTIVLGGIATNFGVESTARDAFERNYELVFVEDAMAGLTAEAHAFACQTIFPRIGRVRSTQQVLDALAVAAA
ncbi:MAG TPA: hydrolase [Gemmatimonadales bacterium]|jgi:nicotinamidase-related amidase|nr:hydrolase [Gemmatimonadales bacterium]